MQGNNSVWAVIGGGLAAVLLAVLSAEHVDLTVRWAEALIGAGGAAMALGGAYLAVARKR